MSRAARLRALQRLTVLVPAVCAGLHETGRHTLLAVALPLGLGTLLAMALVLGLSFLFGGPPSVNITVRSSDPVDAVRAFV